MKRLALLLLLCLPCFGQIPIVPIPTPVPSWGSFSGAGTVVNPTDFNFPICRATDGNTEFNFDGTQKGASFPLTASGSNVDHRWNANHTLLAVQRNGAVKSMILSISFPGTSCTVTPVYIIAGSFAFSAVQPLVAYTFDVAALKKYDFGGTVLGVTCTLAAPCVTLIHDFATGTCIPGISPASTTVFLQSHSDTFFNIGLSTVGGQGTATILATYLIGSGERVLNTGATTTLGIAPNTVCGDYGPTGLVTMIGGNCPGAGSTVCGTCTGGVVCPDQTSMHESYASPNDATPWVLYDLGAPCPQCGGDNEWTWLVSGLIITVQNFSGHFALGYSHIFHNTNAPQGQDAIFQVVSGGALVFPITRYTVISASNLAASGSPHLDNHISWQNVDPNDTVSPFLTNTTYFAGFANNTAANYANSGLPPSAMGGIQCATIACAPATNPFLGPFVNEIESVALTNPPGNGIPCAASPCTTLPINRYAHEYNDTVSEFFGAQQATGAISPDGALYAWTTTAFCSLNDSTNDGNVICGGPDWKASNSTYVVGNLISPIKGNNANYTYKIVSCAGPCVSGAVKPTVWTQTTGANVTDNTITWQSIGRQNAREDTFVVLLIPPTNTKQFPAPPKQLLAEQFPWLRRRARYGL